jgi:hypothetical protein
MKQETTFYSDVQIAEIVGRAAQSLRNDRHQGKGLPYYRIGRSVRYKLSEVLSYMEQRRVDPEESRR